jgi:hypothetical protein
MAAATGLAAAGLAWLALVDPVLGIPRWLPALLAALTLVLARGRPGASILGGLAAAWTAGALVEPHELRADAVGYFAWLRSAYFDHDLDFANEWQRWSARTYPPTPVGRAANPYAIGSALAWAPAYAAADVYARLARALGGPHAVDGFSTPYYRAAAAGTLAWAVAGMVLLHRVAAAIAGGTPAWIGLLAAIGATPAVYYFLWQPAMAHGLVTALTAVGVWAVWRAREEPTPLRFAVTGAVLGLVTLTRWQAVVCVALVAPLLLATRRSVRAAHLAALGGAFLGLVSLQLLAWKAVYGRFLTIPQGGGFMDWSGPYWVDVILSADHGLFTWTPAALAGVCGLALLLRGRERGLAAAGLAVFAASVWINGSVAADWAGSDSFGARRFDVTIPFLALGLASLAAAGTRLVARRPAAVPAAAVAALVAWNLGFIGLFERRVLRGTSSFERVLTGQARQAGELASDWAFRVAGDRGRALLYKALVGEYFYYNLHLDGTIDLAASRQDVLASGWSDLSRREGWPLFRWALYPEACVRVPLLAPIDLRVAVTARAPGRIDGQGMGLFANGAAAGRADLGHEFADHAFLVPAAALRAGENLLCLRFDRAAPGEAEGGAAAAVTRIQLP